ncbi:MAG: GNAT family N-acetyltransferase [Cyanobacteria bacterium P01_A01_bin.83]
MVILQQATLQQLTALLNADNVIKLDKFKVPQEAIVPKFLLELAIEQLSQEPMNCFWRSPRLIVVDKLIVGMCSFKNLPTVDGKVEIGYGIIPSQQKRGFATQAVKLLLEEAFSVAEIKAIIAYTDSLNISSQRVLEKNDFSKVGSKVDPEDGEVLVWQKTRECENILPSFCEAARYEASPLRHMRLTESPLCDPLKGC